MDILDDSLVYELIEDVFLVMWYYNDLEFVVIRVWYVVGIFLFFDDLSERKEVDILIILFSYLGNNEVELDVLGNDF